MGEWPEIGMVVHPDHLQNWLDFGHGLLIYLILAPIRLVWRPPGSNEGKRRLTSSAVYLYFEFGWNLFPKVQLKKITDSEHGLVPNLKLCLSSLLMHVFVARPRWVMKPLCFRCDRIYPASRSSGHGNMATYQTATELAVCSRQAIFQSELADIVTVLVKLKWQGYNGKCHPGGRLALQYYYLGILLKSLQQFGNRISIYVY